MVNKTFKKCGLLSSEHVVLTDLTLVGIKKKVGQNDHMHNYTSYANQMTRADPFHETYSNCSTPTPNGSPSIVYWYKVLINMAANVHITLC